MAEAIGTIGVVIGQAEKHLLEIFMQSWTPDSWKTKPLAQRIDYPNPASLQKTLGALVHLPPLVTQLGTRVSE